MILLDCNHGNESVIALHTANGARKGSKTIIMLILRHAKQFHAHGDPWKVIGNSKGWGGGRGWRRQKRLSLQGKYGVTCELTFSKRVGVPNHFPEKDNKSVLGTSIPSNKYHVTNAMEALLPTKSYKAVFSSALL